VGSSENTLAQTTVAILCGGRGTRLRPTTDEVPKALVPLNGRPILDHIVEFYQGKGVERFILCVGYKADRIREHFSTRRNGLEIAYSDVGEHASMLQRIWALRDEIGDRLIVSYGDTFIDLDLADLMAQHQMRGRALTIVTARIRSPFGLVSKDPTGLVTSFQEKPLLEYYIGSFVLESDGLDAVSEGLLAEPDGQGLVNFFGVLRAQGRLGAYQHDGLQITFNTETERQMAEEHLGSFYTFSEGE
jgi:NDP-sugar pyrophosphorylase family protein